MAKQKKVERWSYPFKTRSGAEANDPQQYYDALAKAAGGFYPLSRNGLWHGGVHFDEGSASVLDQSEVRCIADGEVIAYRIDEEYPSVSYGEGDAVRKTPYSTGFVLVRHRLELPPAATSASAATPGEEPDLVFYSLYMHLLDWKGYQQKPGLRRPTFWGGDSHQVKASASDRVLGLRVRKQPNGSILGVLPRGTLVEAEAGIGQWLRFVRAIPAVDGVAENSGYIYEDNQNKLKALGGNQYLVGPSASDPVTPLRKGLNIRANASAHAGILGVLPPGTRVRIASAASVSKYHKLLEILSGDAIPALAHEQLASEGYVWRNDLEAAQEPQACGSVVPVEPPVAISAGSPIGHLGQYQAYSQDAPQSMLHLEVFSCQDVEAFIAQSRARATQLRPEAKTLLKVPAETKLIIRDDVTQDDPPKISDPGLPTGHDMIIPLAVLNALPNERKITLETNVDGVQQTTRWWKLERMPGKDGQAIDGWLCEIENITSRHSPWDWEGFDFIRETSTLGAQYVCRLDADGTLDDGEKTNYQAHIDEGDSGPIKQRLYDLIDLDDDQRLTAEEIRTALECPWHAQSIGRLITCYESEWYADETMSKWTALDCYMTKEGERDWEQEKLRIRTLLWWRSLNSAINGENGKSWHIHLAGILTNHYQSFGTVITLEMLKAVNPTESDIHHQEILPILNKYSRVYNLENKREIAHFLSQIAHESQLRIVTERLDYGPINMRRTFGCRTYNGQSGYNAATDDCNFGRLREKLWTHESEYSLNGENLGSYVYANRMGNGPEETREGYKYRGRGMIQITGKAAYEEFQRIHNHNNPDDIQDFLSTPELVSDSIEYGIESAFAYWFGKTNHWGEKLSEIAKTGTVSEVTQIVNGGQNGFSDRKHRFNAIAPLLGLNME